MFLPVDGEQANARGVATARGVEWTALYDRQQALRAEARRASFPRSEKINLFQPQSRTPTVARMEDRPLQCPNCSQRMTLRSVKSEEAKPTSSIFECKPCKLSISETIDDDPDKRTLQ